MKVLSVVGARPQFVKLSAMSHEFSRRGVNHIIVHTGQHYDPILSDVFFRDLEIPKPDQHLGVGSAGHGRQTGWMLERLDDVFLNHDPDWVLTYGDTNSTLAAAVSAVKLHFPVAHLEAGLRSFNRSMPEEINRVLTDHAADLCLAPTDLAMANLSAEGLGSCSVLVGDVMTDVLFHIRDRVLPTRTPKGIAEGLGPYRIATIHRAENTDDAERLEEIIDALASSDLPVVLLAHPRLVRRSAELRIRLDRGQIRVSSPLPYPDLLAAMIASVGVVTDSGGLQKEAFLLRVPCTTVRAETEWTETVDLGWNVLATKKGDILRAMSRPRPPETVEAPYGIGDAAAKVFESLSETTRPPSTL